jgi:hypothetical protein
MAGLTPQGWNPKTFTEILTAITDNLRTSFGSGTETTVDAILMQIIDPIALEIAEPWAGMTLIYDQLNGNVAEGVVLDNIGTITNTPRVAGSKSTVIVQATGTEGASIPANFQRGVETTNKLFETLQEFTLPAVGLQPFEFSMSALEDGEVQAIAGTLNQGSLPAGVTVMINAVDAVLGSFDETDEEYRIGRVERLSAFGSSTIPAIKAAILSIVGVSGATIIENVENLTDVNGIPPHKFRAVVAGGSDQDIIDAIGVKKPAGIGTNGAISGTYTDPTDGQEFPIDFSRTTSILMYSDIVIVKNDDYPTDGDNLIEANLLALNWELGEDVVLPKLQGAVTTIPGITSYTLFFAKTAVPLTDTTVVIAPGETALFDSTRINITS